MSGRVEASEGAAIIQAWTSYEPKPAQDDEYQCGGCREFIAKGDTIWWEQPHYEYGDCDGYCQACALQTAQGYEAIVAAIDSGEIRP